MSGDVFKEDVFGGDFTGDPCDFWPEMARIGIAFSDARQGEGLAGITGRDDMNAATPRAAVKGFEIVPDRSLSQGRVCHPRHDSGRGETVSLDITNSSIAGFCEMQSEVQSGDTGAKTDSAKLARFVWGVKSHIWPPFRRAHVAWVQGSVVASND